MKPVLSSLAAAALSLAMLPMAHAQMTTMYGVGSCTGMNAINGRAIAGTAQLSVDGTLIPPGFGGAVFNQAECLCQSRDINMHFFLSSPAGQGQPPSAAMYIGESTCSDPSMRSTKLCDQVTTTNPPNNSGWVLNGTSFQNIAQFDVSIPPEVVTTPKAANGDYTQCNASAVQDYTVTITIGPDMMSDSCTMPVQVNTQGPLAPTGTTVVSGDSGLTVSWSSPGGTTTGIDSYQVLCRKTADPSHAAMPTDFLDKTRYYFSACINKHLFRRTLGGLMMNSTDLSTAANVPITTTQFPLDPRLRCSDRIMANVGQLSTRLNGLENGQYYDVMVVSIDAYGNATGSAVAQGKPEAVAGPLTDYCNGGDCPGFGCQTVPGRPTVPGQPVGMAVAAAALLSLSLLRRRARRVA